MPEAQYLAHEARLYDALATLDVDGAANGAAGVKALEALAAEPYDFPVLVTKMSRAIVVAQQGNRADGERLMREALAEWNTRQALREPSSALEKDVAEIRGLVFAPLGGPVYASARAWNAFSWPQALPPFLVVNPDVSVKFVDGAGGTRRREANVMVEAPNQPVGRSLDLIRFLAEFFQARPGHWGGWEFFTYPVVSQIEFTNAERTAARARVVIGYSGGDVLLEKSGGTWKATKLVNMWVT